jgi:hypothetical protein
MTEIVCISGQQWLPYSYFKVQYEGPIRSAFERGAHFVLGAAEGVDAHAQQLLDLLCEHNPDHEKRVTIFNKGDKDDRLNPNFKLVNGFSSYPERGAAMTKVATKIICVLAAFGAASSGSLLDVLTVELKDEAVATRVCEILRAHSESKTAFEAALWKVTPIYSTLYDSSAIEMKIVEDMCARSGVKYMN